MIPSALRTFSTSTRLSFPKLRRTPQKDKWTPALAPGVLPAYDEALALILKDANQKRAELEELKKQLESTSDSERNLILKRLEKLDIESEINVPEVRWNFRMGLFDLEKPVYRHLLEQRWRTKGRLDQLMERLYQMHVLPDVLPSLDPTVDIHVDFSSTTIPSLITRKRGRTRRAEAQLRHVEARAKALSNVEPGIFLMPEETIRYPKLKAQVFHPETRLYTLLMVDLDVPNPATHSFQSYLHWIIPNIPLSATNSEIPIPQNQFVPYIPPHPQKGSPYHRYVTLVLPHSSAQPIDISGDKRPKRTGFDVRAFVKEYGLDGAGRGGGGAHMWREIWDESVTRIYQDLLHKPEPVFGKPRRADPYRNEDGTKPSKYLLSTVGVEEPEVVDASGIRASS